MSDDTRPVRTVSAPTLKVKRSPLTCISGNGPVGGNRAKSGAPVQDAKKIAKDDSLVVAEILQTQSEADYGSESGSHLCNQALHTRASMYVIPDSGLPGGEWPTGSWYGDWPDGFDGRALKRHLGRQARAARKVAEAAAEPHRAMVHRDDQLLDFARLLQLRIGDERAVGLLNSLWRSGKLSDSDLSCIRKGVREGDLDRASSSASGTGGRSSAAGGARGRERGHKRRKRTKQRSRDAGRDGAERVAEPGEGRDSKRESRKKDRSRSRKYLSGKGKASRPSVRV